MDLIFTFLTTQGHGGPPRMSDQPNAKATSKTAQTRKTIHTKHTLSHPNKAKMEWWWRPNDIRGPWGPKVSWHLSYRRGKTSKKNLAQETCPDRGSSPGPLRDKCACYHLLHSGGRVLGLINVIICKLFIFQCPIGRDIKTTVKIRNIVFSTFSHTYQLLLYIVDAPT